MTELLRFEYYERHIWSLLCRVRDLTLGCRLLTHLLVKLGFHPIPAHAVGSQRNAIATGLFTLFENP
jgi:hypothetical protein